MSDEPVAACPACGCAAERLISGGAGLLFKGDGFYITDHRSESYRERALEEGGTAEGTSEAPGPSKGTSTESGAKPSGGGESNGSG